jgi:hydrogenase/urease accessory protein HupE
MNGLLNLARLFIGLCLLLVHKPGFSHDLGVTKATLLEQPGQSYQLIVAAPPGMASYFNPPRIPNRCVFDGNPKGQQTPEQIRYQFHCSEMPLTVGDILYLPWQREGTLFSVIWLDGSESSRFFSRQADVIQVDLAVLKARSGTHLDAAKRYTSLGIEHILLGIDHLLFVLCLLLIARKTWPLIKTITGFTIAHSITLALATLGIIHIPSLPVEAAIALSIAFLAAEILHHRWGHDTGLTYDYPWLVAFGFGLLHGLGFAGALAELGLPQTEIPVALFFFNVGVEMGQLLFVLVCLLLIWTFRRLSFFKGGWLEMATAYSVGGIATYWFLNRTTSIVFF